MSSATANALLPFGIILGVLNWMLVMPLRILFYKFMRFTCHIVFNLFDFNLRVFIPGSRSDREESIIFYKIRKTMRSNRKSGKFNAVLSVLNYFNYLKFDTSSSTYNPDPDEANYEHLFHHLDLSELLKKYLFIYVNLGLSGYILYVFYGRNSRLRSTDVHFAVDKELLNQNLNTDEGTALNFFSFLLLILIYFTNNSKNRKDIKNWLTSKMSISVGSIKDSNHTVLNTIGEIEKDLKKYKFVLFEEVDSPDILLCTTAFEDIYENIEFQGMVEDGYFENGKVVRIIQIVDFDDFTVIRDEFVSCNIYVMEKDRKVIRRHFFQLRRIIKFGFHMGMRELNFYDLVSIFVLFVYFLTSIEWSGILDYIFIVWSILFPIFFANIKRRKSIVVSFDFYTQDNSIYRSLVTGNDHKIMEVITGYKHPNVTFAYSDDGKCYFNELKKSFDKTHEILSCIIKVLRNVNYDWPQLGLQVEDFGRILQHFKAFSTVKLFLRFEEMNSQGKPVVTTICYENVELRRLRKVKENEFFLDQCKDGKPYSRMTSSNVGVLFTVGQNNELVVTTNVDVPESIPGEQMKDIAFPKRRFLKQNNNSRGVTKNPIRNGAHNV